MLGILLSFWVSAYVQRAMTAMLVLGRVYITNPNFMHYYIRKIPQKLPYICMNQGLIPFQNGVPLPETNSQEIASWNLIKLLQMNVLSFVAVN